ncbi:TPA: minor capsid protein [Streptococcus pneumoniae]|nr:minor capsid protein [Streptococcus pneumoniae]HEV6650014.1 minor capsid protein [Streptococcus pneumoniae]
MIQKNDFADVLLEHIKGIQDKIPSKLGYLAEKEGLVVYTLPGGDVVDEDMAGTQIVDLPFEIAIKSKDQKLIDTTLWQINTALSKIGLELPSKNNSYNFLGLEVKKPYLNELDEQGFYTYLLDVTANLEIERKE